MNKSEIYEWIKKEIAGRWPDVELSQAMKDDLYGGLLSVGPDYATQAAKQQRADSQAKHPNTARIVKIARELQAASQPEERSRLWQNICITRVLTVKPETGVASRFEVGYIAETWHRIQASVNMDDPEKQCILLESERQQAENYYGNEAKWEFFINDGNAARKRSYELKQQKFSNTR